MTTEAQMSTTTPNRAFFAGVAVLLPLLGGTGAYAVLRLAGVDGGVNRDYFSTMAQVIPVLGLALAGEAIALALKPPPEARPGEEADFLTVVWTSVIVAEALALTCVAAGTDSLLLAVVLGAFSLFIAVNVAYMAFYRWEYRDTGPVDRIVELITRQGQPMTPSEVRVHLCRDGSKLSKGRVLSALRYAASEEGGARIRKVDDMRYAPLSEHAMEASTTAEPGDQHSH